MNERIKELQFQAAAQVNPLLEGSEWQQVFVENFAELIVRECMRMCDVAAVGYDSHGHTKEANGCASAREYIEEHFGVE